MKYFLTTILLLLFVQLNVKAQRNSVFQSIVNDNGYSPYQKLVAPDFQFLLEDDLTRVLFNPSYLSRIDSNQVYTTIDTGNNNNYRFAYISRKGWLFQASFQSYLEDANSNVVTKSLESSSNVNGNLITQQTRTIENESYNRNEALSNLAELKFSKLITSSGSTAKSIGIYLNYDGSDYERDYGSINFNNSVTQLTRNDTLTNTDTWGGERVNIGDENSTYHRLRLGFEFAYSNENTQGYQRVYTQYSDLKEVSNRFQRDIDDRYMVNFEDTTNSSLYTYEQDNFRVQSNNSPWIIGYNAYLNHRMDWNGEDYVFIALDASYGVDTNDLDNSIINVNGSTIDSIVQPTETSNVSLIGSGDKEYQFNADLRFGYAIRLRLDDFSIFTGISQTLGYIQHEGYFMRTYMGIQKYNDNYHRSVSTLPIFTEYALNEWFSFFGGAQFNLVYTSSRKQERLDTPYIDDGDLAFDVEFHNFKSTRNDFYNQTNTYFGFKASHKSGIRILADLNGDLARLSNWDITIGYQF